MIHIFLHAQIQRNPTYYELRHVLLITPMLTSIPQNETKSTNSEVSDTVEIPSINSLSINNATQEPSTGGDWDDANANNTINVTAPGAEAAELMDMNALKLKRNEQDDIAERLRVEETKAKLAAARDGMEKEAQRLKDEKEAKELKKKEQVNKASGGRFGAAAVGVSAGIGGGGGGKWVPVHMRNSMGSGASRPSLGVAGAGSSRFGAAAANTGFQRKVDTANEELFPDLATAGKLMQQEEDEKAAIGAAKQAAFAKKARAEANARRKAEKLLEEEELRKQEEAEAAALAAEEEAKAETDSATATATAAAPAPAKKVKKKKKKKDLSSFKPS